MRYKVARTEFGRWVVKRRAIFFAPVVCSFRELNEVDTTLVELRLVQLR